MRISIPVLTLTLALGAVAQTFRVSGVVVDSETGKPLNRTRVVLSGLLGSEWNVVTTDTGTFSFDVPQGKYTLTAAHRDWGDFYGEPVPGSDSGSTVITSPDLDTSRLVFRFRAPVAIHGKIADESGNPIPSATVELFRQTVVRGKRYLTPLERAESDDFGDYSYSQLPAGTYYAVAAGEPWPFSDFFNALGQLTESGTPPVPYGPVFFPNAIDPSTASPLILHPGAELQVDFTLRLSAGANLHYECGSAAACGGSLDLYAVGPGGAEALIHKDVFQREVIPPGRYVFRYTGPEGVMRRVLDVSGGDLTLEIAPKPAPSVTGKVSFQNPANRPRHRLFVNLLDEDTGQTTPIVVGPDGAFAWSAVPASHVRLFLSDSDGFFIAQMSVDGAAVNDALIDLAGGASVHVNLVVSSETGRITGHIKDGGQPVSRALVVLAPAAVSGDPNRYRSVRTESDGSFDCPDLPSGDYVLFAVDNLELEYANPRAIRPYLANGVRLKVNAHRTRTEDIGLARPAGQQQ
jgi:hypothetical protein